MQSDPRLEVLKDLLTQATQALMEMQDGKSSEGEDPMSKEGSPEEEKMDAMEGAHDDAPDIGMPGDKDEEDEDGLRKFMEDRGREVPPKVGSMMGSMGSRKPGMKSGKY